MRPTQRRTRTSVIERLLAAPQGFEFVQAITLLLGWLEEQGVAPEQALRAQLRFRNSLLLGFPPSEIEALQVGRTAQEAPGDPMRDPGAAAGGEGEPPAADSLQFTLTPTFMGLLGVHGALPAHYTERIAQWQHERQDEAPRAFLDMLSGRMLALYYGAWRKYRVEYAAARQDDDFRTRLLALAGEGADHGLGSGLPGGLVACFAGLLQQRPRSAAVLERLLTGYFGLPLRVEEAVGHWSCMAPHEQSALGAGACLGENTLLGERSWRPDLRARLRIGPLGRNAFERLLPSGDMAAALRAILAWFAVPGVDFEVQLILRADEVGPSRLAGIPATGATATGATATGARLGRDSFLVTGAVAGDRADMRYLIRPMAPLPARARRGVPS